MMKRALLIAASLLTFAAPAFAAEDGAVFLKRLERVAPQHADLTPPVLCVCQGGGGQNRVGQLMPALLADGGSLSYYITCAIPRFEWLNGNKPGDLVGHPFEVTCPTFLILPNR